MPAGGATNKLAAPKPLPLWRPAAAVVALLLPAAVATLALRLEAAGAHQIGLVGHQVGQLVAQRIDAALEVAVEHVGHHDHAAAHPLARARELGVRELGHAAVAIDDRIEHAHHGVGAEAVALSDVADGVLAGQRELTHGGLSGDVGRGPRPGSPIVA